MFSDIDGAGALLLHDREVPLSIRSHYGLYWSLAVVILCSACFVRFVCLDTLGALVTLMLAATAIFLTRHDYIHMNRQRLSMYGVACFVQLMVELLAVCLSLSGRRSYHWRRMTTSLNGITRSTYVRSFEVHQFIDKTQPWTYNMQSMMMVVMPFVLQYMVFLCFVTWRYFRDNDEPEIGVVERNILFNAQAHGMYGAPTAADNTQTQAVPFQGKPHKLIDAVCALNSKENVSLNTGEVDNTKAPETNTTCGPQPQT